MQEAKSNLTRVVEVASLKVREAQQNALELEQTKVRSFQKIFAADKENKGPLPKKLKTSK